ncbi:MAG: lactate utilization protein [Marinobacter sp.]|uniref:LutC/YkgG family protein n=1 Tax=Marinobacter sp. TaxID=50741 RepID=UPI00299E4540|nr:lactate utilization protein [Marinobacter sp.]MDX1756163.1 lactate utilization protein [Marinobacter sp.]
MSSARSTILARLRQGRAGQDWSAPDSDFSVVAERRWTAAEKLDRFEARMTSVNTEVVRVPESDWVECLKGRLQEKSLANLLVASELAHGRALARSWEGGDPQLVAYNRPFEQWPAGLFNHVEASLTGCRGAIAETGTLILWPTPQEPRLMSLVPPVHFVLLHASELYATLSEAMADQDWAGRGMPSNAVLVSGPSKTADIEQTLAYGVHGPRELVVLVLQ